MAKYINADVLISDIKQMRDTSNGYSDTFDKSEIIGVIEEQPAADVRENVHGEWLYQELIPNDITGTMHGECSVCHKVRIIDKFCPNCGADMRGEEHDN